MATHATKRKMTPRRLYCARWMAVLVSVHQHRYEDPKPRATRARKEVTTMTISALRTLAIIAATCHEANRQHCAEHEDFSHLPWKETPQDVKDSAINGVRFAFDNDDATPESMNAEWQRFKKEQGWTNGPNKSFDQKTHPNLGIAFGDLAPSERAKDFIFLSIVRAYKNAGFKA